MNRKPDSYSYHDTTQCDDRGKVTEVRWVVIAEWLDADGDIEETDVVSDHRTEAQAVRALAKLESGEVAP